MKAVFVVFAALVAATYAVASNEAGTCSCTMPESVRTAYESETTPMYKANVVTALDVPNSAYTWTVMDVKVTFRGCAPSTPHIIVKSPKTAAGCGVDFEPNTMYLTTVRKSGSSTPPPNVSAFGLDVYSAVSCNFNKKWEDVPYEDQKFCFYSPVRGC